MLLGIYNYTVILTYFGMLVAYTGITWPSTAICTARWSA